VNYLSGKRPDFSGLFVYLEPSRTLTAFSQTLNEFINVEYGAISIPNCIVPSATIYGTLLQWDCIERQKARQASHKGGEELVARRGDELFDHDGGWFRFRKTAGAVNVNIKCA